jgi:alcohol dehydrogenase (quinone), cytochrome c subunit
MARSRKLYWLITALIALVLIIATLSSRVGGPAGSGADRSVANDPALVERGHYLALAGNCASCHTRSGGAPFAGGVPFETPFGKLYSSNVTADPVHGIGNWSPADLARALHEGVSARGHRLFPAFPYPSFTKITDEDVKAIYAYLQTVAADAYDPPSNSFLLKQRWGMAIWNGLFFRPDRFKPDTTQSAEWNRGAYLVDALGHCGACHTPRNAFMAEMQDKAYQGGVVPERVDGDKVRDWSAVNLTSSPAGLKEWTVAGLTKYLHTGFSPRAGSFGPMNEVIANSTSQLTAEDAQAMATYIKSLPAGGEADTRLVDAQALKAGEGIYHDRCAKCHGDSGRGGMFQGPPLFASAVVRASNPASLINAILYGAIPPNGIKLGGWETMKPYADVLSDAEVAAVASYVRGTWGNQASQVDAALVAKQR